MTSAGSNAMLPMLSVLSTATAGSLVGGAGQDCDGTVAIRLLSGHHPSGRRAPDSRHPGPADRSTPGHKAGPSKGQADPGNAPGSSQSQQSPTLPIEGTRPESLARWGNAQDANC